MKNKRINIFIFKLKFLLPRIMSSFKKKKIKNNSNFVNFDVLVKAITRLTEKNISVSCSSNLILADDEKAKKLRKNVPRDI